MYQITCNDYILYDNRLDNLIVIDPKLSLEVNTTGAFNFKIYDNHPYYGEIKKLKSIIKIYQNGKLIFRGRVLEDKQDFNNGKQVDCEGELAFLLDSVYRPFDLTGQEVSVREFFTDLINNHNSQVEDFQKFILGDITVEDPNEKINFSSESALKTWDVIKTRLIENLGGYLYVTYNDQEMPIINYLLDFTDTSTQTIEFGKNMLDITQLISGAEIATAVMPFGAKLKDAEGNETVERLTIKEVNGGLDYIVDNEMVEEYGLIFADPTDTTWDDVTIASNLLTKAQNYLAESVKISTTIELKAIDLSTVYDIESFYFCDYIRVLSSYHNIDKTYLLRKIEKELLNPENTTITLGETFKSLTDTSINNDKSSNQLIKKVETIEKDYVTNQTVQVIINESLEDSTLIKQTAEEVTLSALQNYVLQTNFESFRETNTTELQVLAEQIIANFNTTTSQIEDVDGDLQQKYQEFYSWIRGYMNDTGQPVIELGSEQSNIKLKLENDEIFFDVNGQKRFYLTAEGKIVFKNAVFEETTEINGFAFVPRSNGNLSFVKVKEG